MAVLFDWSGTISDDRRPVYEANKKMCAHWGLEIESFEEWTHSASMTPIEGFRKKGLTASDDEIYRVYRHYFHEVLNDGSHPALIPGARQALVSLHAADIPLGIVSSHPQIYLEPEARKYEILPLVDVLHGDTRNKIETLKEVCQIMGLDRATTMYVGDTIYDIRSAAEAGLVTAGVTTGYHTREALEAEEPNHLLSNLNELFQIPNLANPKSGVRS
jgi:phosphoglycolate phosphatase